MIIRDATEADIPALVEHGRPFLAQVAPAGHTLDEEELPVAMKVLIEIEDGLVQVAERDGCVIGGMLALAHKPIMCKERQLREIAWWVDPSERGSWRIFRMLDRFEEFAAARACLTAVIVVVDGVTPPGLEAYLRRRRGYVLGETALYRAI